MSTWEARRVQAIDYGLEVKSQPRPACRFKQTQKFLGWWWCCWVGPVIVLDNVP
ncbi:hypothetical protein CSPX01_10748 [Colletotrichum filicis]|nr:hypothetical protein CSPX01_10748 [Colletotrichum filicis]